MRTDLKSEYGVDITPIYYSLESEQEKVDQLAKSIESTSNELQSKAKSPE